MYRARDLSESKLTREQVGIRKEGAECIGCGLGAYKLYECGGI